MVNLLMDYFISILLKLALTVVKDVFCDVICANAKKYMAVSSDTLKPIQRQK